MPDQTATATTATPDLLTHPAAGGSYTRQPDGTLVKDEAAPIVATATTAASADLVDTATTAASADLVDTAATTPTAQE